MEPIFFESVAQETVQEAYYTKLQASKRGHNIEWVGEGGSATTTTICNPIDQQVVHHLRAIQRTSKLDRSRRLTWAQCHR